MKPERTDGRDEIENDPVWELLRRGSSPVPSARFVDDVVRQSRLEAAGGAAPCWSRWFAPVPALSAAGFAVAVGMGVFVAFQPGREPAAPVASQVEREDGDFKHLQEVLEVEMLIAAVEQPDSVSDGELLTLIGL